MLGYNSIAAPPVFELAEILQEKLSNIHTAIILGKQVTIPEIRNALQRSAALLCGSKAAHAAISHHLVSVPFQVFSRESIESGVSLWLGVIHENPRLEPTILSEVIQGWENTILRRRALFDPSFR